MWSRGGQGRNGGSATIELVAITPFILAVAGLVLDVRTLGNMRTDMVRQTFALAEVIASEAVRNPVATVMTEAMAEFRDNSAGTFAVAVITRGTERGSGVACVDNEWCLPKVAWTWPPQPGDGTWNTPALCPAVGTGLPAAGEHFAAHQQVLPNENADGATHENWLSRNLTPEGWWIVLDTCLDPTPGLFWSGLATAFDFELSGLALRKRAAWISVHDLSDCRWCAP